MYGSKSGKYGDYSEDYAGYQVTYKKFLQAPDTLDVIIRRDNPLTVEKSVDLPNHALYCLPNPG